jgi:hypothetical protein
MSARTRTTHVFITQPDHHQTIDTLYGMDGWRERPSASRARQDLDFRRACQPSKNL